MEKKQEIIRIEDYQDSRKLMGDLFELIKSRLGKDHEKDCLKGVFSSKSLFPVYLNKYHELRKENIIITPSCTENAPCKLEENIAIEEILKKARIRAYAAANISSNAAILDDFNINNANREKECFIDDYFNYERKMYAIKEIIAKINPEIFTKTIFQLHNQVFSSKMESDDLGLSEDSNFKISPEAIEAIKKYLTKLTIRMIGMQNIANMSPEVIKTIGCNLKNGLASLVTINMFAVDIGENIAKMSPEMIEVIGNNLCPESIKAIGANNIALMSPEVIKKTGCHLINCKKIEAIGGENIAKMSPEMIEVISKHLSVEEILKHLDVIIKAKTASDILAIIINKNGNVTTMKPEVIKAVVNCLSTEKIIAIGAENLTKMSPGVIKTIGKYLSLEKILDNLDLVIRAEVESDIIKIKIFRARDSLLSN